jgi:hypothetical protein
MSTPAGQGFRTVGEPEGMSRNSRSSLFSELRVANVVSLLVAGQLRARVAERR